MKRQRRRWESMYLDLRNKEYQKALDYFGKAANAGVKAAAQNRDELSKWLDEQ